MTPPATPGPGHRQRQRIEHRAAARRPSPPYGFEEATGTRRPTASGAATPARSPARRPPRKFGGALAFDGVNDRVTVPDVELARPHTAMTLEAWVRPTAAGDVADRDAQGAPGGSYALYASSDRRRPRVHRAHRERRATPAADRRARGQRLDAPRRTYDGTALRLYVNGVQVATAPDAPIVPHRSPAHRRQQHLGRSGSPARSTRSACTTARSRRPRSWPTATSRSTRVAEPRPTDGGEGNRTPTSALQRPRAPVITTPPGGLKV